MFYQFVCEDFSVVSGMAYKIGNATHNNDNNVVIGGVGFPFGNI